MIIQARKNETNKKKFDSLRESQIRIFHHSSFDDPLEEKNILADIPRMDVFLVENRKIQKLRAAKLSPEMRPCYESPLLDFEQEQHLFKKMNYCKYKAKKILNEINPDRVNSKKIEMVESYLSMANSVRNEIAQANFRLATQILKNRKNSTEDLSDAYLDVLKAVDYFDWTLGNKFSTYATWVIRNNFFRDCKQRAIHLERFTHLDDAKANSICSRTDENEEERAYADKKRLVNKLLKLISKDETNKDKKRQLIILENYFGVNGKDRKTLEEISVTIGVTKERVRQLKEKGLSLIQKKIEELGIQYEI